MAHKVASGGGGASRGTGRPGREAVDRIGDGGEPGEGHHQRRLAGRLRAVERWIERAADVVEDIDAQDLRLAVVMSIITSLRAAP